MVRRGLVRSRNLARELIRSGKVRVAGRSEVKPSTGVTPSTPIELENTHIWVSRGGRKLQSALDGFGIDVVGRNAIDLGASTGGFTEVLLRSGIESVLCLDVGHGQLSPILESDARVTSIEGRNVRDLRPGEFGGCFQVVVVDLSFISLTKVTDKIADLACPEADIVALVKPQFEVQRSDLGSGGVLRDALKRDAALQSVIKSFRDHGLGPRGISPSPILGGDGNQEFLLWAVKGARGLDLEVST